MVDQGLGKPRKVQLVDRVRTIVRGPIGRIVRPEQSRDLSHAWLGLSRRVVVDTHNAVCVIRLQLDAGVEEIEEATEDFLLHRRDLPLWISVALQPEEDSPGLDVLQADFYAVVVYVPSRGEELPAELDVSRI